MINHCDQFSINFLMLLLNLIVLLLILPFRSFLNWLIFSMKKIFWLIFSVKEVPRLLKFLRRLNDNFQSTSRMLLIKSCKIRYSEKLTKRLYKRWFSCLSNQNFLFFSIMWQWATITLKRLMYFIKIFDWNCLKASTVNLT